MDLPKHLSLNFVVSKKKPVTNQIKIFQPPALSATISKLQKVCSKLGCIKIHQEPNSVYLIQLFNHPNGTLVTYSINKIKILGNIN